MASADRLEEPFAGRIFFDHVPKTAGSALSVWLTEALGSGSVSPTIYGPYRELIRRFGGAFPIVCGHAHFAPGEKLDPRYMHVTCLRDPLDRAISWLFYALGELEGGPHEEMRRWIAEFIESDGRILRDGLRPSISNFYVNHFSRLALSTPGPGEDVIRHCERALDGYTIVGFQEDLLAFARSIAALIGLPQPSQIGLVNATARRPALASSGTGLLQVLAEINELDVTLYERLRTSHRGLAQPRRHAGATRLKPYELPSPHAFVTLQIVVASAAVREGSRISRGQLITIDVEFLVPDEQSDMVIGLQILDDDMRTAFAVNSKLLGSPADDVARGAHTATYCLFADLPVGVYSVGFVAFQAVPEGEKYLAWREGLCVFEVVDDAPEPYSGYAYLLSEYALSPSALARDASVVTHPKGSIRLDARLAEMRAGEHALAEVVVSNAGSEDWVGDAFRPIRMAYRWLDGDGSVVIDGERTALPVGGVPAGRTLRLTMDVFAPESAGVYGLVLSLVQESAAWFEEIGGDFQREVIEVTVAERP